MNNDFYSIDSAPRIGRLLLALACILLMLLVLLLSGCGSGSGGDTGVTAAPITPSTKVVLEGRAADGYLTNAEVYLDRNGNKLPDAGEPSTLTDADGHFSLEVAAGEEQLYPVVVRVVQYRSYDLDDASTARYDYILETPVGRHDFISPLTTLVKQELDKNFLYSEADAVNLVRTRFGLSATVSPWQDYIVGEQGTSNTYAWQQAHEAARILAGLQGRLLDSISQQLGGLQDDDYLPATRLIGDLQLQYAQQIANTLGGITPAAATSKDQLIDQLLAEIDLSGVDRQLLSRYRQLIAKQPDSWDATPPTLIACQPASGASIPVTGSIELAFSEALDPATVQDNSILLSTGSGIVSGRVSYDKNRFLLIMVPSQPLAAYTTYTVSLAPTLTDTLGNPLGQVPSWQFNTLFGQTPPALPTM